MNSGRKVYSDEIFIKAAALGQASSGLAFCTLLYYFSLSQFTIAYIFWKGRGILRAEAW
jgi:hypothetical protein